MILVISGGPNVSSLLESIDFTSSISITYYQWKDENFLVECLTCRSYFELNTFCPWY